MVKIEDEKIEKILKERRAAIRKAYCNRVTYSSWNRKSPIYGYNWLTKECVKITKKKDIEDLLLYPTADCIYFSSKEDMENYKWIHNLIDSVCNNNMLRIMDNFLQDVVKK